MIRQRLTRVVVSISLLLLMSSCAHLSAGEDERMLQLGSALTKLSKAVEYTVRYTNPPETLSDPDLLALATQEDPTLLDPFKDFTVRVLRQDRHAILLVCTPDQQRALLEDAGCSAKLDKHAWKEKLSCEFTLSVSSACPAP